MRSKSEEKKMNKKQWIALGFMFMIFAFLASHFATEYGMAVAITGDISFRGEYFYN